MPRKILIVDDQEDILLILEREFRRLPGTVVMSASKFAQAASLVTEKQVDLVISDVRLGQESGFDLVREINRTRPGTGTILMSAYRSPLNRQQAENLGVICFLEKPFPIAKLIEEVKTYFEQKENPDAAVEPVLPAAPVPPAAVTKTNSLIHFALSDLVQLFCLNGRDILITVTPGTGRAPGEIYIQRGRLTHADFEEKNGDEAFLALMQLVEPILKVKDWTAPVPVTVESRWEQLLLQSAIRSDQVPGRQASGHA